jgi:hypothetical protein
MQVELPDVVRRTLACLAALLMLAGCSQEELLQKFSTPEDQAVAKGYIDHLRARNFQEIEKAIDPSIRTPDLRDTLTKMAGLIPAGEPNSIKLVGAQRHTAPAATLVNTTFEYNFGDKWFLANVAIQDKNGTKTIVGLNVNPLRQSVESLNRFALSGKTGTQYLVLGAAVTVVLVSLYALILCVRTKPLRRKWLWMLFILFGFGKIAVNWTTGEWEIALLAVQLLSASALAPLFGPWTIAVSIPVGALVFLYYRRSRRVPEAQS